jgi:hypothetical protein
VLVALPVAEGDGCAEGRPAAGVQAHRRRVQRAATKRIAGEAYAPNATLTFSESAATGAATWIVRVG